MVWSMPTSVGVSSCAGGEWLALQRGGEEVVTHQLTAQTAHVHSTGGDKQVLNVHTCTHRHIHTHTQRLLTTHCHPNVHMCTHTHTQAYQHMTRLRKSHSHSRCTNVISSLTSIIGLLSGHSGQWSSYCNGGSSCGSDSTGELSPH